MNLTTRSLLRASVLAPAAVVLAVSAAPADAGDGPVAYLVKDTVNKNVPADAANVVNPVVQLPAATVDGVISVAKGNAKVKRARGGAEEAVVNLGKGLVKTAGADLAFSGLSARCVTAADGTVRGVTKVVKGKLVGTAGLKLPEVPRIPVAPPANFRVPTTDPGMVVMLNKQVRDPLGGMTVSGVSVDSAPGTAGAAREFGVARCAPVQKVAGAVQPQRLGLRKAPGDPVTDLAGGLVGTLIGTVQPGQAVTGVLGNPQVAKTGLPVDPARLLAKPAVPAVPKVPAAPAVPAAPGVPAAPALPAAPAAPAVPAVPATPAVPELPIGLSALLGGLPGMTGVVGGSGLPALPAVPVVG